MDKHLSQTANGKLSSANGLRSVERLPEIDNELLQAAILRRFKEIIYEHYPEGQWPEEAKKGLAEIRRQFMLVVHMMPYRQVVESGYANRLLNAYLSVLAIAEEAWDMPSGRYAEEREYYYYHPKIVKKVALQLKHFIAQ